MTITFCTTLLTLHKRVLYDSIMGINARKKNNKALPLAGFVVFVD
jgi:hypothetical protein